MTTTDVLFLEEGENKSPDLRINRGKEEFFVECKMMRRGYGYTGKERIDFLKLWDELTPALVANGQWLWFDSEFRVLPQSLPTNYFLEASKSFLPIQQAGKHVVWDDGKVGIRARLIDKNKIQNHLKSYSVKFNSPKFRQLIHGDMEVSDEIPTTFLYKIDEYSELKGCAPELGRYVEKVGFACGMTRIILSDESLRIKARDIRKLLSNAVKQVPKDKPSIIHIGIEATDGVDVEKARNQKLREIVRFKFDDVPVSLVRLHRFVPLPHADLLFDFIETKDDLYIHNTIPSLIPTFVVVPNNRGVFGSLWGDLSS